MPYPTLSLARSPLRHRRWLAWWALPVLGALLWGSLAQAAPAPWYWWVSKLDGQRVCAQHMPTHGWERAEGPFTQAGCQVQQPRALLGGAGR